MYSLTIQPANEFRDKLTTPKVWRRIYRWEDKWGILHGDNWRAEIRKTVATDGEKFILEAVTPYFTYAPPPDVDDVWEEEVHILPYGACGNVLTIQGTLLEIQKICATNRIPLPSAITSYVPETIMQAPTRTDTTNIQRGAYSNRGVSRGGSRGGARGGAHGRGSHHSGVPNRQRNVCLIVDV